jgi:putative Holliday junction resolvase
MTILAIDYGSAKVGLAVGDSMTKMAFPFRTLNNSSRVELLQAIENVIFEENVERLVVGEPIAAHTNAPQNESSRSAVKDFAQQLESATNLPVVLVDERFTTEQAKQLKKDGSNSTDHELAAMLILQTYFDMSKE